MAIRSRRSTGRPPRAGRCSSAGTIQEQRDQSVVFLLDTGRRMRALDGGVPQFDHVLNAILLVAHVALRQGDQVAVKSFGGTDRWLPPMKGSHAMPVLLNHLYDYQTTPAPSDFSGAVEKLMARQRRRSLVILLTNLRGEDGKELLPAMQVLQSRHLVLLASMREGVVQDAFSEPVDSFSSALRYLAADRYVQERREILASLGASGILTLDSTAKEFPGGSRQPLFRHQGGRQAVIRSRDRVMAMRPICGMIFLVRDSTIAPPKGPRASEQGIRRPWFFHRSVSNPRPIERSDPPECRQFLRDHGMAMWPVCGMSPRKG